MNKAPNHMLSTLVPLQEQFVRSTRIDDTKPSNIIYSSTIDQFLKTLASHQSSSPPQGAYTWTGPYGSGKSTLAQSLITALCGDIEVSSKYPLETQRAIEKAFNLKNARWHCLPLIGAKENFQKRLAQVLNDLSIISDSNELSAINIVTAVERYAASANAGAGLVIIVDEMGKFLEEAINNDGDVYLFQLLAEAATRSNGRFVFIGILHQSIQEYAVTAIKRVRDEWSKVQGRFVDIALNLTSTEQVELIAKTINFSAPPEEHKKNSASFIEMLSDLKQTPYQDLVTYLEKSWPLNPTVAYVLGPISKRSYGQNQRSIFSFLSSNEPYGFRRFLAETPANFSVCKGYSLDILWDYLNTNWSAIISASQDSQSFSIVKEALIQIDSKFATDSKSYENLIRLLKSIHLIELTKHETGLVTNSDILSVALGISKNSVINLIQQLKDANIVSERSYNGSLFLHEGSDFNLDAVLAEELDAGANLEISSLNGEFLPAAIVAKRHFLTTGTLRWADIKFATVGQEYNVLEHFDPSSSHFARFVLSIDSKTSDLMKIINDHEQRNRLVVGDLSLSNVQIDTIREFEALLKISDKRNELSKDRIARREVNDRIDIRRNEITNFLLEKIIDVRWYVPALNHAVEDKSLSQVASTLADALFKDTLILKNELINRTKVSGNAKRASKQFLYDLLQKEGDYSLGYYEKFPPERAIFETLLVENEMYIKENGSWRLTVPNPKKCEGAKRLNNLFNTTLVYLKNNQGRLVAFPEIYNNIWQQEPFGVKAGLYPILSVIFTKLYSNELIFYQDKVFVSSLSEIDCDYFLRAPKYCALRYVSFDQKTEQILNAFALVPSQLGFAAPISNQPLDVARSLVAIYDALPVWTKKTSKISSNAKKVRTVFAKAIDPAQFMLVDLPNLFGEVEMRDDFQLTKVVENITSCLDELINFQDRVISEFKSHLFRELGLSNDDSTAFAELAQRAENVRKMSGDNRMETFITNLLILNPEPVCFERLAGMLLNKPSKNWIDNDVERLFVEATNYCRHFNTLETMTHIKRRDDYKQAVSVVIQVSSSSDLKQMNMEISDGDKQAAISLSNQLKSLMKQNKLEWNSATLVGALAILLEEAEK